jgi:exodeoxyribonuclease VII large subunit
MTADRIWSISELARRFSARLDEDWPPLWVRGEVSGCRVHGASGHSYLTLKDAAAQFAAVLWRGRAQGLSLTPVDGQRVEARVRLVFYGPGGRLQLEILDLRPAGLGDLMQALLALKERLAAEGLFDAGRKRPLPPQPEAIGLLTAAGSAALADMTKILHRRRPWIRLVLQPVPVQGPGCGAALARGLARLARQPGLDLIILGRGGGSFEDLFGFNDEALVRAIAACPLPVISAVGHEIDTTLSDLVADLRAPTPSAAAELAVPDQAELLQRLTQLRRRQHLALEGRLADLRLRLRTLQRDRAFHEPRRRLDEARQRLDEAQGRLRSALLGRAGLAAERLAGRSRRLARALGRAGTEAARRLLGLHQRLEGAARRRREAAAGGLDRVAARLWPAALRRHSTLAARLAALDARLAALDQARIARQALRLGFARVLLRQEEGRALTRAADGRAGQAVTLQFADGGLHARIEGPAPPPVGADSGPEGRERKP